MSVPLCVKHTVPLRPLPFIRCGPRVETVESILPLILPSMAPYRYSPIHGDIVNETNQKRGEQYSDRERVLGEVIMLLEGEFCFERACFLFSACCPDEAFVFRLNMLCICGWSNHRNVNDVSSSCRKRSLDVFVLFLQWNFSCRPCSAREESIHRRLQRANRGNVG